MCFCFANGGNPLDELPKEEQEKRLKETQEMLDTMPPDQREALLEMGRKMGKVVEGGASGKEKQKKKPKEAKKPKEKKKIMTLKNGRHLMRDMVAALTGAEARDALGELQGQERASVAEERVAPILKRYSIGGGLQHAMQTAMASGADKGGTDQEIRTLGEDIEEALSGQPSQSRLGRVLALDSLAEKFLDMSASARSKALTTAQQTAGGEVYAEIMREIMEEGDAHIVGAVVALARMGEPAAEGRAEFQARMNVLQEFLRTEDLERVAARLRGGAEEL